MMVPPFPAHLAVGEDLGGDLHSCLATGRQLQRLGRATHAEYQRSLVPYGAGGVQGEGYSDIWVCACAGRLDADREGAGDLRVQCEVELEVVVQASVLVQPILPHALPGVQGERPRKVRRCDVQSLELWQRRMHERAVQTLTTQPLEI